MKQNSGRAAISGKLKALLNIADHVRLGGRAVKPQDVERARQEGATDQEIHDTVLIAAAFCMYNRYVDGLATWAPQAPEPKDIIREMRITPSAILSLPAKGE